MRDRKQRSAINAVLNLVHDAQMTKSRENTLICLLLDVKEAFDHVALKQLIKILIKLKILINLINWVKCFLQNRVIDLAFDDERQKSKEIITEILQDSFISLILFLIYIRYLFSKIRAKIENLQSLSYIDDVALYVKRKNIDKNVKKHWKMQQKSLLHEQRKMQCNSMTQNLNWYTLKVIKWHSIKWLFYSITWS